ncbi:PEP-CTERM sorting domain-containing protein, partial [Candidatus Falkowbacteria bacterium]|nr:PEP-CTERM sorting domain-containing protein [Candidatus Falkowbacteria bacterium]
ASAIPYTVTMIQQGVGDFNYFEFLIPTVYPTTITAPASNFSSPGWSSVLVNDHFLAAKGPSVETLTYDFMYDTAKSLIEPDLTPNGDFELFTYAFSVDAAGHKTLRDFTLLYWDGSMLLGMYSIFNPPEWPTQLDGYEPLFDRSGYTAGYQIPDASPGTAPVPEPSTVVLLGLGLTLAIVWQIKKAVPNTNATT